MYITVPIHLVLSRVLNEALSNQTYDAAEKKIMEEVIRKLERSRKRAENQCRRQKIRRAQEEQ